MSRPGERQISCWLPKVDKFEFDLHLKQAKMNKTAVIGGLIAGWNAERRHLQELEKSVAREAPG